MPAYKKKPQGIGAKYRQKKAAAKTAYKSANYGVSKTDEKAMMKMAEKIAERTVSKNVETQRSQALVTFKHVNGGTAGPTAGWNLPGLNQWWPTGATNWTFLPSQMMVFNLSSLSQVKGTQSGSISGWRQGNKINVQGLTVSVRGKIQDLAADCKYHLMLVRRKDGTGAGSYTTPTIINAPTAALYKPLESGPYFNANAAASVTNPVPQHLSLLRRNTDAWSFVEKGHAVKQVLASPTGNRFVTEDGTATSESGMIGSLDFDLYHSFNTVWDFTTNTQMQAGVAPVLKGGDYYLFFWREGPGDVQAETAFNLYMELAYKDA
ncbi:MAG: hypothetical protein [Cressdnaviricota sp.]|nr:MAG: hypothetical protein [Cressdnaviricota sp.]